ncbi:copper resistance protein CopC [Bacillus sp. EB600]|uniref:copper resistance protein CopC n=1 Tax=Bacillus sp. EB600 TaxID=2806345 RepID=UPI00210CEFBC|nr:copper resistance protein CopC [Bacillus sp. EB600]MCQ6278848.1 copper resistance protein CopC [Bacillus sp. EB600]
MKFYKQIFLFILTIIIVVFSFPALSSAHAYIIKSFPADNQNLNQPPKKISIEFNEEIQPAFYSFHVFDRNGKRVDKGNGHIRNNNSRVIEASLKPGLPAGIYNISWKVVSGDGHPVDGVIPFEIGSASKNNPVLKSKTTGYIPHLDLIIIRWAQYISSSIYVGMLFFYLCILPRGSLRSASIEKRYRKIVNFAYILLCLSILVSLPLQAVIQVNLSWMEVWNPSILKALLLNSSFGKVWLVQFTVLVLLAILSSRSFAKKSPLSLWISFVLGISLLAGKAITSHASTATNKYLAITMDTLHLVSASIWIGSIIAMVTLLPLRKKEEGKVFFRGLIHLYFPWGVLTVLVLAATGVYSSFLYVPTFNSLFHTNYGRLLVGKVILFVILLVFAFRNSLKGRKGSGYGWKALLWGEVITGFVVLAVAVILTNLPTAMSAPGPFNGTKTVENNHTISLKIGPNVSGPNRFNVIVKDNNGKPITNIEQASLTFTSKEMDMGENTITIQKVKNGQFQIQGMYLNMAGRWNVHVHVLTRSLDSLDTDFSVPVGT